MFKIFRNISMAVMMTVAMFGCGKTTDVASADGITLLAGSEIKNIEPLLKDAEKSLGFPITVKYAGTVEGVEDIKAGANYDLAWFGNAKYFYDTDEGSKRIKLSEKIMFSPVIIGVKESSFTKNKLNENAMYNWKDIAGWVKDKKMTYAMTDPSSSNTGYVALMGVVYATANKGENVKIGDVNQQVLQNFFKGQKVTAKSSTWIMDSFNSNPDIDFVVNYESSILNNPTKLVPVYPSEGIVTADYPMLLLNVKKTEQYKKLVAFFKSSEVQSKLTNTYKYRAIAPDVMIKQTIFDQSKLLIEMPFNPDVQLSDAILTAYFNDLKKPAKFAFVIDTSGSMGGERENQMRDSMNKLITGQLSKFATIRNRESVLVVPFSSQPYDAVWFSSEKKPELLNYINSLRMEGGTAMYEAVAQAITHLKNDQKVNGSKYAYSIIVLTDGMSNQGAGSEAFKNWYIDQNITKGDMRVFAISFGDSDIAQLTSLTAITDGKIFEGRTSLGAAFREIRTYQ